MILDTVFISRLINGNPKAWEKAQEISDSEIEQNITHVVLFELLYGALRTEDADLIRRANNARFMFNIDEMGIEEVIEGAQRLAQADICNGGESGVGQRDGMISGVAAVNNETVLTENVSDFSKLNVEVERFSNE